MTAGGSQYRLPARVDARTVLAFDVGGTDIKSALVLPSGEVLGLRRTSTPKSRVSPELAVIEALVGLKDEYSRVHPSISPQAIGLSVPGIVDEAAGVGVFSANLGWIDAPVLELARSAFELPVALSHDVRAAALAESRHGAAVGYDDVAFVVIGTGLSAAFILDGRLFRGHGLVGEVGHIQIEPNGDECSCGARGCLETIASAAAIAARYERRSGADLGDGGARAVVERMTAGDPVARAIWSEATEGLATGLAQIVSLLAPELIVFGGGLAGAGDDLIAPVSLALDRNLTFQKRPRIVQAQLGGEAGLLGAAIGAQDMLAGGVATQ